MEESRLMDKRKTYGRTRSGQVITDELVEEMVAEAEAGFDTDEMLRRRGGRSSNGQG
jgi:hypothetical protein